VHDDLRKDIKAAMADAEETAIAVLVWLAGEPELMGRFLALTGLEASAIFAKPPRNRAFLPVFSVS
jgi:hypothetical protein